jgi:hypothetical protein
MNYERVKGQPLQFNLSYNYAMPKTLQDLPPTVLSLHLEARIVCKLLTAEY